MDTSLAIAKLCTMEVYSDMPKGDDKNELIKEIGNKLDVVKFGDETLAIDRRKRANKRSHLM